MQSILALLTTLSAAVAVVSAASSIEESSATCVTSSAASTATSWTLDYAEVTAPVTGTGYDIDAAFQTAYGFNSTMVCLVSLSLFSFFHSFFLSAFSRSVRWALLAVVVVAACAVRYMPCGVLSGERRKKRKKNGQKAACC